MKYLIITLSLMLASSAFAVDLDQVEKDLAGKGVEGWIHGAIKDRDLYVFTVRNPHDFFDYAELSLVTDQPDIIAQLAALNRHDKILLKGKFLKNPSPQKHVKIESLKVIQKYTPSYTAKEPYEYEAKIPDELLKSTRETFLVHAIGGDGHILVTEYKDAIVPFYVKTGDLTKNLWRGDIVQLAYKVQDKPEDGPTHLNIDEQAAEPVKVIEAIKDKHGQPFSIEGALILFPKSPEIAFNVFAVQQELQAGLKRQFTIVNNENPDAFKRIREKLQAAWDKHPGDFVNGRNKLVSRVIRVKATGTYNELKTNQANPQVLVKDADSVQIIETK